MKTKINVFLSCFLLLLVVTVINSCSDDDEGKPKPTASFTASKTTAETDEVITFTNTSENASSYLWSFGDGTTSTVESPTKSYTAADTYTVTLVATGPGGVSTKAVDITITEPEVGTEIFFIDADDEVINRFSIADPDDMTTFLEVTGMAGVGLAYDDTHEKIYFSDFNATDVGKIWSVNLAGTGLDDIAVELVEPYAVAVDVAGGKIYYADGADSEDVGHIYRSNLDGSGVETIVTMDGAGFRAVALDLTNDKLYFYEVQLENLYISNLDGTEQDIIVDGVYGYGIIVDAPNGKIYFDDQNSNDGNGALLMADLDGDNVETVDNTASRIYGLAIDADEDKLYWSARDNGEIYQADLDGSNKITLKDGLSSPRGMFLKK